MMKMTDAITRHVVDKTADRMERDGDAEYDARPLIVRRRKLLDVRDEAKPSCKKCHGCGRLGFLDGDRTRPLVCNCRLVTKEVVESKRGGGAAVLDDEDERPGHGAGEEE